jgi:HicA toxin of bacterial toxin-antitoxin,
MSRKRPGPRPTARMKGEGAPPPARRQEPPPLSGRHRATLGAIFERPTRADISWRSIEALFRALGGEVSEGRGSRVRVALLGRRGVFHEPHPDPATDKGAVEDVRDFLISVGVRP